ncbi:copper homeostasis membrane protein CopD [Jejubacter calystegiae]|uniref:Copper resistance protein D n=1 Tax=Jejubacter calystegiae TaxID=2579935 RepID=A0A4P8YLY5_9ENTR|nr:copper homeostasis membrane protein CopD [Jejubacter calystegiae]QCT21820.1 copper homeostasis membrane protein CopD [Jejubacter calystegiae]
MLHLVAVAMRFSHDLALMLLVGSAICSVLLSSGRFASVVTRRLARLWSAAALLNLVSALLLFALQGGLMGQGWSDVLNPDIWRMLPGTRFGAVWLWQMVLALIIVAVTLLRPPRRSPLLLCLAALQLALLAGTGHAAMHDGVAGALHRTNHAVHLLAAAWWVGGLVPLLVCMRMATKPRWRKSAIAAMMRFSRYGHLAVALVIATGAINSLAILGWHWSWQGDYVRLLLLKMGLASVMVAIALVNRYLLVPRFAQSAGVAQQRFIILTRVEMALALAVLLCVSLFATLEPF